MMQCHVIFQEFWLLVLSQFVKLILYTVAVAVLLLDDLCSGSSLFLRFLNCCLSAPVWSPPIDSTSDAFCFIFMDWSMYFCATVSDLCPAVFYR